MKGTKTTERTLVIRCTVLIPSAQGQQNSSRCTSERLDIARKSLSDWNVKDPLHTIERLLQVLRPGGLLAFQEIDIEAQCWSEPTVPLVHKCFHWIVTAFARSGMPTDIGRLLQDHFVRAGLVHRHIVREGLMESGDNELAFGFLARTVRSLAPLIEKLHLATPNELGLDTLEQRLRDETLAVQGHFIPCYLLNAWARKPC